MMPAPTTRSPESPIVAHGPFNFSSIPEVRRFAIGRAIVLTGPGIKQLVNADRPLELVSLLKGFVTGGYTFYTVVDTTAKHTTRNEAKRLTASPRYTFNLVITMAARVADPIAYLDDFHPDASIFDAFYSELVEDISNTLADCSPYDIREAQRLISEYAASIRRDQPYHKGLQILQFNVGLEYGSELARRIQTLDQLDVHERYGDKFLAIEGAVDPALKERNEDLTKKLWDIEDRQRNKRFDDLNRGLDAVKKFSEVTGEELSKVVQRSRLYESLGNLVESPRVLERASDAFLIASDQISAAPPPLSIAGHVGAVDDAASTGSEGGSPASIPVELNAALLEEAENIIAGDPELLELAAAVSVEAAGSRLGHRLAPDSEEVIDTSAAWNLFKDEIFQLLCTRDRKYEDLRRQLRTADLSTRNFVIPAIASTIAAMLGVNAGLLTPFAALALLGAAQIQVNAWCSNRKGKAQTNFASPDGKALRLKKTSPHPEQTHSQRDSNASAPEDA